MPKNKFGGSKHKKMAKKHINFVQRKTRYASSEQELYVCCNQIFGGGNIKVVSDKNIEYLCYIRNKFKGRGKRDNIVKVGSWLLVGKREYETVKTGKLQKCDLLEVYNEYDKLNLEQNVLDINWGIFKNVGIIQDESTNNTLFEFTNDIPDDTPENDVSLNTISDEEIDVDDI